MYVSVRSTPISEHMQYHVGQNPHDRTYITNTYISLLYLHVIQPPTSAYMSYTAHIPLHYPTCRWGPTVALAIPVPTVLVQPLEFHISGWDSHLQAIPGPVRPSKAPEGPPAQPPCHLRVRGF